MTQPPREATGAQARSRRPNRYQQIIEWIFQSRYQEGAREIAFTREEFQRAAGELGIPVPKNVGDILYSFRYRASLPESVRAKAPPGEDWVIRSTGRSRYVFAAQPGLSLVPSQLLVETKIPDATPGIIAMYALDDEQALLAKLRYNRLIDIFTGVSCYSLQSHRRTATPEMGQVETDEIYLGIDQRGVHYVFPVEAKGARERLGVVQIEQNIAVCARTFPSLVCRPIAAQFMADDLIALFEFTMTDSGVALAAEKHYRLVPPDQLAPEELALYRGRP